MTALIIMGAVTAVMAVFGIGAAYIAYENKKAKNEAAQELKEIKENAQKQADAITEAEKDKSEVRTGDHARDLHTMADKLHKYANNGK